MASWSTTEEIERDISANFQTEEISPRVVLKDIDPQGFEALDFPEPWRFKIDPDKKGIAAKWFDPALQDDNWEPIHTDIGQGWNTQGVDPEHAVGCGWYRAALPGGRQQWQMAHLYLHFGAVDMDAYVYLNGRLIMEHSRATTGLAPEELWIRPFVADISDAVNDQGPNQLTVRVHNLSKHGGIHKPVHFVAAAMPLEQRQIEAVTKICCVDKSQPEYRFTSMPPYLEREPGDTITDATTGATWSTRDMGGVVATPGQLWEMHKEQYILHAKDGRLRKVPAEKTPLPLDPFSHVQRLGLFAAPDGTIYAIQYALLSRSTDGGKTWTHLFRKPIEVTDKKESSKIPGEFDSLQVLADGSWIRFRKLTVEDEIQRSTDQGLNWQPIDQIGKDLGADVANWGLHVLRDGTVIAPLTVVHDATLADYKFVLCRSNDGGATFSPPVDICKDGFEVSVAELSSGRLLAVVRYQRRALPSDPPEVHQRDKTGYPYKHVFVTDSTDRGTTWSPLRQLTTVTGQCHGQAVGLADGRTVVVHDSRSDGTKSARAMVSDDEGTTWRDEVYYLSHGDAAGYARTISLDGREMLTLTGSFYGDGYDWANLIGKSRHHIIRWRLAD